MSKRKYEEVETYSPPSLMDIYHIYKVGEEVHFTEDINDETIEVVIRLMSDIIKKKAGDNIDVDFTITYIVDSPGGSVTSILKFVDFLRLTKQKYSNIKFVSIATGCIASAATIMCIVADERYITQNALAMLHELSSSMSSQRMTFVKSHYKCCEMMMKILRNIYINRSHQTSDKIDKILQEETWFTAQDYFDHGFVDGIK
jgi:ATP-dependent Clp protease, protease subunit